MTFSLPSPRNWQLPIPTETPDWLTTSYKKQQRLRSKLTRRIQDMLPQEQTDQRLLLSSLSLGMTATAFVVPSASGLAVMSLPLSLAVFAPTLQDAYQTLREERRINNDVLTATRLGLCTVMHFYGIAALDAFLQSVSRKLHMQSEQDWEATRQSIISQLATDEVTEQRLASWFTHSVETQSAVQTRGALQADRFAPYMFASFFATLPFYDAGRAGAFLMTSFGAHTNMLSPTTVRDFVNQAAHHSILVRDARALESAETCDLLIINTDLLAKHTARSNFSLALKALRQQHPDLLVIAISHKQNTPARAILHRTVGLDEWICVASQADQVDTLQTFQRQGRHVCYIGDGITDQALLSAAHLSIAINPQTMESDNPAHIILLGQDPFTRLDHLFTLASQFNHRQAFNFKAPIVFDVLDITTTIVIHFGLFYSVLFNYSGLLLSTLNAREPFWWFKQDRKRKETKQLSAPIQWTPNALDENSQVEPQHSTT
ncbi:MAG: hypothetical protein ACPG8W_00225 [Candidatus Promineifilaceae bacterium]